MDSEDPAALDPLSMPLCGNHVNWITQEHAPLFFLLPRRPIDISDIFCHMALIAETPFCT
jgi:hypothetical protein